jgi:hypothetical protein
MKRLDLIRHWERHGCDFSRAGGQHTLYSNRPETRIFAVARRQEVIESTARKICKDLEVQLP